MFFITQDSSAICRQICWRQLQFFRLVFALLLPLITFQLHAATLKPGDIVVTDHSIGVLQVNPVSGARTIVSDFTDTNQGELGQSPFNLAFDLSGSLLVVDPGVNKLFRINPETGQRALISDFSNPAQGPTADSGG